MAITKVKWLKNMAFDVELNNHHFTIDADSSVGGNDQGPRPKGLLLAGLAGCTGMDVVSILKKMKVDNFSLEIDVDADLTTEHPIVYSKIYLNYKFEGQNLPIDKLKKAVKLSETRYCGVSAMLSKACEIETSIYLNREKLV